MDLLFHNSLFFLITSFNNINSSLLFKNILNFNLLFSYKSFNELSIFNEDKYSTFSNLFLYIINLSKLLFLKSVDKLNLLNFNFFSSNVFRINP